MPSSACSEHSEVERPRSKKKVHAPFYLSPTCILILHIARNNNCKDINKAHRGDHKKRPIYFMTQQYQTHYSKFTHLHLLAYLSLCTHCKNFICSTRTHFKTSHTNPVTNPGYFRDISFHKPLITNTLPENKILRKKCDILLSKTLNVLVRFLYVTLCNRVG